MKNISVKELESLKKEGWRISSADFNVISGQISSQKMSAAAAAAVVGALDAINKTIENIEIPQTDLKPLLDKQFEQLATIIAAQPTTWVFDIKRNNNGFIDKVVANAQ